MWSSICRPGPYEKQKQNINTTPTLRLPTCTVFNTRYPGSLKWKVPLSVNTEPEAVQIHIWALPCCCCASSRTRSELHSENLQIQNVEVCLPPSRGQETVLPSIARTFRKWTLHCTVLLKRTEGERRLPCLFTLLVQIWPLCCVCSTRNRVFLASRSRLALRALYHAT